jgi:hypothetical protein
MRAKCVYENLDFERGKDPKKSIGIGKYRDFYGKTEDQIASKIISDLEYFLDPYFGQLSDLVEEKGYESIEEYSESIWDEAGQEPLPEKQDPEIESFINDIFKIAEEFIKEKYPVKKPYRDSRYLEPAASIASTVINAYIEGAPHGTMLREISKEIDMSLLESLEFERGKDPKSSIDIGLRAKTYPIHILKIYNVHPIHVYKGNELEDFMSKYKSLISKAPSDFLTRSNDPNAMFWPDYISLENLKRAGFLGIRYNDNYILFDNIKETYTG